MPHKSLEVQDLLADETFQSYCLRNDKRCVAYWEDWQSRNPESQETFREAERIFSILSGKRKNVDISLRKLRELTADVEVADINPRRSYVNVAASVAVLICLSLGLLYYAGTFKREHLSKQILPPKKMEYSTHAGERKLVVLNDGSRIILNAASRLTVDKGFNDTARIVTLNGEAYFEVAHLPKKPFIVKGEHFDVRVLGTHFNVKSYEGERRSEATLLQGAILVKDKSNNGGLIMLKPKQKIVFHELREARPVFAGEPDSIWRISIEPYVTLPGKIIAETAWTSNRLEIYNQKFCDFKGSLERWFDVEIEIKSKEVCDYMFTATFKGESLVEVLSSLQKVKHFNFKIYGKRILITN